MAVACVEKTLCLRDLILQLYIGVGVFRCDWIGMYNDAGNNSGVVRRIMRFLAFSANVYSGMNAIKSLSSPFWKRDSNVDNLEQYRFLDCVVAVGGSLLITKIDSIVWNIERIVKSV